jgi:hypothetical protein
MPVRGKSYTGNSNDMKLKRADNCCYINVKNIENGSDTLKGFCGATVY